MIVKIVVMSLVLVASVAIGVVGLVQLFLAVVTRERRHWAKGLAWIAIALAGGAASAGYLGVKAWNHLQATSRDAVRSAADSTGHASAESRRGPAN
jgi:hypothetical protein